MPNGDVILETPEFLHILVFDNETSASIISPVIQCYEARSFVHHVVLSATATVHRELCAAPIDLQSNSFFWVQNGGNITANQLTGFNIMSGATRYRISANTGTVSVMLLVRKKKTIGFF
jgi:hypothetical protein